VSNVDFLRMACNARRKSKGQPELDPLEFYAHVVPKVRARSRHRGNGGPAAASAPERLRRWAACGRPCASSPRARGCRQAEAGRAACRAWQRLWGPPCDQRDVITLWLTLTTWCPPTPPIPRLPVRAPTTKPLPPSHPPTRPPPTSHPRTLPPPLLPHPPNSWSCSRWTPPS
jgi:hypothetical protein